MPSNPTKRGADAAPVIAPVLYSATQLTKIEPALSIGAIRDDLFHRETNGLEASGAVVYRGRKILLHRERYLAWLIDGPKRRPNAGRRAAA
jgi:hypothetical protein